MITTFKTLSGSVYQYKTEDDRTFVRRLSGVYEATPRLVGETSEVEWQECDSVKVETGKPAIIAWGKHRPPLIPGTDVWPLTVTSYVGEIVSDQDEKDETR